MGSSGKGNDSYDLSFKILLIGDSGVGKSSLLLTFISSSTEYLSPAIGVDFKIKLLKVGGKRLELTIWDTVRDVTSRESFMKLCDIWAKEVELYLTNHNCVKMLVENKVDRDSERVVSMKEGMTLAEETGRLFLECCMRTRKNVERCFKELVLKIMEDPGLLEDGSVMKRSIIMQKQDKQPTSTCCSG